MTMSTTPQTALTPAERRLLMNEVHEALAEQGRDVLQRSSEQANGGLVDLERHIDQLVSIVRRSSATRIEPYLAQILDHICTKCPYQQPSGHCPLRYAGDCLMYRHAGPIVAAVRRGLREIDIERELAGRKEQPCSGACQPCNKCSA